MMSNTDSSPFPDVRRVVTGHTDSGISTVLVDGTIEPYKLAPGLPMFHSNVYRSDETIPSNTVGVQKTLFEQPEGKKHVLVDKSGSVMWAVDLAPKSEASFHRTISLDYGIVIKGSVVLTLDNDERVALGVGDIVVQRGNIHGWVNETDEWARMYFVILSSKKVVVNGKELEEHHMGQ